jgi:WD40 repeat protein
VILRGHHDLIHDLAWSRSDDYLLSASADCSVKIWNLSSLRDAGGANDTYTDKLNYTENDAKYFVCQLLHTSFVYAGGFYPDTAEERDTRLIVASVCYDQRVRLWLVSLDIEGRCLQSEALLELNIIEKKLNDGFNKENGAPEDLLDDETLQMIISPNTIGG